jgi:hypothetical protein
MKEMVKNIKETFTQNMDKEQEAICYVIPFDCECDRITEAENDFQGYYYDKIIITKEDYKWLVAKSKKLEILKRLKK